MIERAHFFREACLLPRALLRVAHQRTLVRFAALPVSMSTYDPKVLMRHVCTGFLTTVCVAALSLAACGDDVAAAAQPDADVVPPDEQCPANLDEFRASSEGLLQTDAKTGISVRLVDADAIPPARDFNTWTIAITDADGNAMPDARLMWACAWMQVHGHGTNPKSIEKLDGGEYVLKKQNLSMYGEWQIKLWITAGGDGTDYVPPGGSGVLDGNVCQPSNGTTGAPNIVFDVCVPRMRGS